MAHLGHAIHSGCKSEQLQCLMGWKDWWYRLVSILHSTWGTNILFGGRFAEEFVTLERRTHAYPYKRLGLSERV